MQCYKASHQPDCRHQHYPRRPDIPLCTKHFWPLLSSHLEHISPGNLDTELVMAAEPFLGNGIKFRKVPEPCRKKKSSRSFTYNSWWSYRYIAWQKWRSKSPCAGRTKLRYNNLGLVLERYLGSYLDALDFKGWGRFIINDWWMNKRSRRCASHSYWPSEPSEWLCYALRTLTSRQAQTQTIYDNTVIAPSRAAIVENEEHMISL